MIGPIDMFVDGAEQRFAEPWPLQVLRIAFVPLFTALLFVSSGAAVLACLRHPVDVETLTLSGVLVAVTIVVFERCIDRPQGSPIAFPAAIATAGGLGLSICLSAGLVDTLSHPRSWPWPVIVWTTTGTTVVMLARLIATASWAGRLLQRGAADLAVILSVDPQAPSVAAARALLRARLGRPLRMRHVSIPSGEEVGQGIDAIIGSLRSLGPAEIILALADEAPEAIKPTATQMKLHDALATLPSRVWQATLGMARPDLKLLIDRPIGEFGWVAKRALDVIGALLLILFTLPLFLIVAAAIKLDSRGPLLFRQYRVGYNDEPFEILKFRSMYHSASDAKGDRLTTRGDPRVTRVGRLIRRTSIDELPQLINVLRGEMSLVGPRPYPLSARAGERLYGEVVANIGRRHRVRPGLTGLAQVSGYRGDTETEARLIGRFALDLTYIERWSLWLDIKILLRTPMSGMLKADVY